MERKRRTERLKEMGWMEVDFWRAVLVGVGGACTRVGSAMERLSIWVDSLVLSSPLQAEDAEP
jgi:hypothetical protein